MWNLDTQHLCLFEHYYTDLLDSTTCFGITVFLAYKKAGNSFSSYHMFIALFICFHNHVSLLYLLEICNTYFVNQNEAQAPIISDLK